MIDFDRIKTIYKIGRDLSLEDIQVIIKNAKSKSFAANEHIIEEGSRKRELFFINKGLIRVFAINEKGEEVTITLRWENQPFLNADIILFGQPSRFYYQAIEPTEVLYMDYDLLQSIVEKNAKFEHNRNKILLKLLQDSQERIGEFVLFSPEERYTRYVQSNPDIVSRVPNKYIANVLGITPVSLSRIRKRLASRKK